MNPRQRRTQISKKRRTLEENRKLALRELMKKLGKPIPVRKVGTKFGTRTHLNDSTMREWNQMEQDRAMRESRRRRN